MSREDSEERSFLITVKVTQNLNLLWRPWYISVGTSAAGMVPSMKNGGSPARVLTLGGAYDWHLTWHRLGKQAPRPAHRGPSARARHTHRVCKWLGGPAPRREHSRFLGGVWGTFVFFCTFISNVWSIPGQVF